MSSAASQSSGFQLPSGGFPLKDVVPDAKQATAALNDLGKVIVGLRTSAVQMGAQIVQAMKSAATSARTLATTGLGRAAAAITKTASTARSRLGTIGSAARAATRRLRQLGQKSRRLRRLWIRMRSAADVFRRVGRNLLSLGRAGRAAFGAFRTHISSALQLADSMTLLQARLQAAADVSGNTGAVFDEVAKRAQDSRTPLQDFANAFVAVQEALEPFPALAGRAGELTELFAKSARLSGASGAEAAERVAELAQAFADGSVSIEELTGIIDAMPDAASRVATSLGEMGLTANGTVEEMRNLAEEGQLSAETFLDAFLKAGTSLEKDFAKAPVTVGEALTLLKNKVALAINEQDRGRGITKKLAQAFANFSQIIPRIAPALGALADGLATVLLEASKHPAVFTAVAGAFTVVQSGALSLVRLFGGALKGGVELAAGGVRKLAGFLSGALSAGLKLVRGGLVSLRGALLSTGVGIILVLLGKLLDMFFNLVDGAGGVGKAFALLGNAAKEIWQRIALGAQLMGKLLSAAWNGVLSFLFAGLDKGLRSAIRFGRLFLAAFTGAFNAMKAVWKNLPAVIGDLVIQGANFVIGAVEGMINKGIEALNDIINFVNRIAPKLGFDLKIKPVSKVELDRIANQYKGAAQNAGAVAAEEMRKALQEAAKQPVDSTPFAKMSEQAAQEAQRAGQRAAEIREELTQPLNAVGELQEAMERGGRAAEETLRKSCEATQKLKEENRTANQNADQAENSAAQAGERAQTAGERAAAGLRETCKQVSAVGKKTADAGRTTQDAMEGAAAATGKASDKLDEMGENISKVSKKAQDLAKSIKDSLRGAFEEVFKNLLDGSLKGFKSFGKKLVDTVRSALAKALVARFIEPFIKDVVDDLATSLDKVLGSKKKSQEEGTASSSQSEIQETGTALTETLDQTKNAIVELKKGCQEGGKGDIPLPGQQQKKKDDKAEEEIKKQQSKFAEIVAGALRGAAFAGLPGLFGLKTSKAGGAAGGALGQLLGGKLGSIIGGLVGSIIGGAFKKTPQASVALVGGQRNTPFTRGGGQAETADRLQSSVLDALDRIAADLGGVVTDVAFGVIGQRGKRFFFNPTATTPDKNTGKAKFGAQVFATGEGAALAAIKEAIRDGVIVGLSDTAKTIAANSRAATPDQFVADLQFAKVFDELVNLGKPTSDFVNRIKDLNRKFAQAISKAHSLGLAEEELAKARERALRQIKEDFDRSVELAILEITDPVRAALEKQKDEQRQFLLDAVAAGADMEQALRKVRLDREQLIEELEQNANAAINAFKKSIRDFIDELRFGDRSRLAERERLPILFARFRDLAEKARTDEEARNQLQDLADKLLKSGEEVFASSAEFFKLQDQVIAILEDVSNSIQTVDVQKIADEVGQIELDPEFQRLMADIGQEIASSNEQVIDLLAQIRDRLPAGPGGQPGQSLPGGGGGTAVTVVGGGGVGFIGAGEFRRVQVA